MRNSLAETKKNTLRLVFSAVISALSFVLIYVGSLSGIFDLCAVTFGAVGMVFAAIELGKLYPWLICAVVSTLCFLLLPDKFSALEYLFLAGIYPIIKFFIERLPKVFSYLIKLVYFNAVLTISIFVASFVFLINEDWAKPGLLIYIFGNVFFIIYDLALSAFTKVYFIKIKPRIKINF